MILSIIWLVALWILTVKIHSLQCDIKRLEIAQKKQEINRLDIRDLYTYILAQKWIRFWYSLPSNNESDNKVYVLGTMFSAKDEKDAIKYEIKEVEIQKWNIYVINDKWEWFLLQDVILYNN